MPQGVITSSEDDPSLSESGVDREQRLAWTLRWFEHQRIARGAQRGVPVCEPQSFSPFAGEEGSRHSGGEIRRSPRNGADTPVGHYEPLLIQKKESN